ncbi:unnamed protein product [Meganyctiphanes norvegica]|uniref:Hexosyltransferase n=1 Tax=Meganyctiphanes norvegica TaxID=48144 RepID=A0AAV2Q1Q9_MEGNR
MSSFRPQRFCGVILKCSRIWRILFIAVPWIGLTYLMILPMLEKLLAYTDYTSTNRVSDDVGNKRFQTFHHNSTKQRLRYLIEEPSLCHDSPDLFMISYVHSAVHKKENRQLIRDTWANLRYYPILRMKVFFVFGAAVSKEEQDVIEKESSQYHDIIQLDFVDSYKNLSLKGVGALQWISEHCMHAPWVLKSDDDMVINTFALQEYLAYHTKGELKGGNSFPDKIICAVWWGMTVLRGTGCAKWCVSEEEWPENSFPTYCSGSAFVIPTHLVPRLYDAYFTAPFLWVDDAYISGVLPREAGIKHRPVHSLYEMNYHLIQRNMIHGNRLFCHHPGRAASRGQWWSLILAKELNA